MRFLIMYLLVYGGINVYAGVRLSVLVRKWTPWGQVALAALIVSMVAGPIFVRWLERTNYVLLAQIVGIVTFTWMALALWFFVLGIACDIWNLAVWAVSMKWRAISALRIGWIRSLIAIGIVIALATVWGAIEAQYIRVREVTIRSHRLPPGAKPIRIAQVSDLHLGLIERDGRLRQVLRILDGIKPDMLVATGDVVDGSAHHMEHLAEMWAAYEPPLGKFAITGNHEIYAGLQQSVAMLQKAGFTMLRGTTLSAGGILMAGVDDPAGFQQTPQLQRVENAILPAAGDARPFTLFLKHRPWIEKTSIGRFDLQLSGHTHAGQVFPFGFFVKKANGALYGWSDLGAGSKLYVTSGAGTWGPRLRLAAPPEITVFTIEPQ